MPPADTRSAIVVTSGYPAPTLEALRRHWRVEDIPCQREAVRILRGRDVMPVAACVGFGEQAPGGDYNASRMLRELRRLDPQMPVVISTAAGHPRTIVDLVKQGAFGYVVEPREPRSAEQIQAYTEELVLVIERAVQWRLMIEENQRLREGLRQRSVSNPIIGDAPAIRQVMALVRKVAPTPATVLITGESGTGKELVAQQIHRLSDRRRAPMLAVNCGSLTETLLASELFGHVQGAFTGADRDQQGLLRQVGKGTLFLDEIGTITPRFQVLLLRLLEQRTARPVGGEKEYAAPCRFIAAANRDLQVMVRRGEFREDLWYRLNIFHIHLPPLRERRCDIPSLAQHFLDELARQYGREIRGMEPAAMGLLESAPWPGNVRQLRNAIERAVIVCEGDRLSAGDFDAHALESPDPAVGMAPVEAGNYHHAMARFERDLLSAAIARSEGNLTRAAERLSLKRTTLHYRLKHLGLSPTRTGQSGPGVEGGP